MLRTIRATTRLFLSHYTLLRHECSGDRKRLDYRITVANDFGMSALSTLPVIASSLLSDTQTFFSHLHVWP
jgi:hypothetical protein